MNCLRHTALILTLALSWLTACGKKPEPVTPVPSASGPKGISVQDSADAAPPVAAPAAEAPPTAEGAPAVPVVEAGEVVDLSRLRAALVTYMQKTGKTPDDLNDLVKAGYFSALPVAPNGYRLFYDPITVSVSMVKKW
jgi:hypothetical protein